MSQEKKLAKIEEKLKGEQTNPGDTEIKVAFHSALGQWDKVIKDLLEEIKPNLNYEVRSWTKMSMENTNDIIVGSYSCMKLLDEINEVPTNKFLQVFIAPITWAAKFNEQKGIKILGPAFGTCQDIYLYFSNNSLLNRKDRDFSLNPLTVGVIQKGITSSLMLRILLHIFHVGNKRNIKFNKEDYKFEDVDDMEFRLLSISEIKSKFKTKKDFAVFTSNEIRELKEQKEFKDFLEKNGHFFKIDDLYAHFNNLEYVPRAVYCIHESQESQKGILDLFFDNIRNKKLNERVFCINPNDTEKTNELDMLIKNASRAGEEINEYSWS